MNIGRTFAAVVFDWDGTAVADRQVSAAGVRQRVEALSRAGIEVAIVSGTDVGNVDGQLLARPVGPGRLFLAVNRGSELYLVTAHGPQLISRRETEPAEDAALDRAAMLLVDELAARGLAVGVISARFNRRKVDLIPEPKWADPSKARIRELLVAVTGRLERQGLKNLSTVVDLAESAARTSGLPDARVTTDAKHIEIGLTDKSDSMRSLLGCLAEVGIGAGLLLVVGDEFGSLGGVSGSDSRLMITEADRAIKVSVGPEPMGVPVGVQHVGGGPRACCGLLDEQLRRHRHRRVPTIDADPAWVIGRLVDPQSIRTVEALFTTGSGGFATRGSLCLDSALSDPGVFAAGLYEGVGSQQGLLRGPAWTTIGTAPAVVNEQVNLDLRTGVLTEVATLTDGSVLRVVRFASLSRPAVVVLRAEAGIGELHLGNPLRSGPLPAMTSGEIDSRFWARTESTGIGGIAAVAVQHIGRDGSIRTIERLAAYTADATRPPALEPARDALSEAEADGFDHLLAEQRSLWAERWASVDVGIPDDPEAEKRIRFAIFQLWNNCSRHDELAVGARGVSGTGYAGHVFWDADVFVLPALVSIDPDAARAMLRYRLNRLGAAQERASAGGFAGARFPWESAATGADVTPASWQLGGVPVPILTGECEEHITADVAWAAVRFAEWTGTEMGSRWPERNLVLETARYWASRCRRDTDGLVHIDAVIGPDEYHESVDDNAFTNVMARWNLRVAARIAQASGEDPAESGEWLALATGLVDGYDAATGIYEQFRGFDGLEPLVAHRIAQPPFAADVLLGPDRVAKSQLIKQPDVLMLHHLVPDEVAAGSLGPNLDFYGPRTTHGSSLSPAITAALLARAGRTDEALRMLRIALDLDLEDLNEVSAAGLHLATLGGIWQAMLGGFAGVEVRNGVLHLDPKLPAAWSALHLNFQCLGRRVRLGIAADVVEVWTDMPLEVSLSGAAAVRVEQRVHLARSVHQAEADR